MRSIPTGSLRPFEGKIALVTGGNRGLGRTTAEWLVRDGASVLISARDEDAVQTAVGEIRRLGGLGQVWGIAADLSKVEEAHRLAEVTLKLVPQLDILI